MTNLSLFLKNWVFRGEVGYFFLEPSYPKGEFGGFPKRFFNIPLNFWGPIFGKKYLGHFCGGLHPFGVFNNNNIYYFFFLCKKRAHLGGDLDERVHTYKRGGGVLIKEGAHKGGRKPERGHNQ